MLHSELEIALVTRGSLSPHLFQGKKSTASIKLTHLPTLISHDIY